MTRKRKDADARPAAPRRGKRSAVVDTRVVYCGDNLDQLQRLPDGCIDLIYIDPPFNSNRNYEVFWGETREKRAFKDRHASTQAYIEFMRPRCVQLARVLKKTGSFYYHCDWHASHYVKVMLDQIFGENQFQCEVIWKRHNARSTSGCWPRVHDSIFLYSGSQEFTFNPLQVLGDKAKRPHTLITADDGLKYQTYELTGPGQTQHGQSGQPWRGFDPSAMGRHWANAPAQMDEWAAQGLIHFPQGGGFPRRRAAEPFEDAGRMVTVGDVWTDIDRINQTAKERLGYPTQKPLALLERIIKASSNPGDIVLDAFCGCGTALVAAENLGRQWIGVDVSPTACRVMAKRLRDVCGLPEDEALWRAGRGFVVRDLPWTEEKLRAIPPFEFENWAVIALGGVPNKTRVGDKGIDGRIYPVSSMPRAAGEAVGELAFMDTWYPVQVKQKDKVGRPEIDQYEAALLREKRTVGFFVAFGYTEDALVEIDAFFRRSGVMIRALTVRDILDEQIAVKLA
jgi:site-specific DNA-methyltransferase (adenine-specific)